MASLGADVVNSDLAHDVSAFLAGLAPAAPADHSAHGAHHGGAHAAGHGAHGAPHDAHGKEKGWVVGLDKRESSKNENTRREMEALSREMFPFIEPYRIEMGQLDEKLL